MFDSRLSASVVVSASNEYVFTKMVNARKHGMFYQSRVKSTKSNKHINSLAALAGKIVRAHFTSFKSCAHKISRYVGCYVMCLLRNCMLFLLLTLVSFKSFSSVDLSFNLSSDCIVTADIEELQFPGLWVINVELKDAEAEILEVLTRDNINESFIFTDDNGKGLTLEPVNLIHALSKHFSIAAYNNQSEAEEALQRMITGTKKCSMRAR